MIGQKPWSIADFSGGKNDKLDGNLIANNQCTDVQNCVAVTVGQLQKRKGQVKLNSSAISTAVLGLHSYYYGDPVTNRKLIAVFKDGTMYYWDPDTLAFVSTGKTDLNTSAQVLFETCVSYMVGMNGVDTPFKYNGTTVSALANAPATGKCPVLHYEKLFCIADTDTIRWSDSFAPESWPAVNTVDFDKGDGDELSALFSYRRALLVCKKRSIHKLTGSTLSDFQQFKVENRHGVSGPKAGIVFGLYFYYISEDGIFKFDGAESVDLVTNAIPLTWAGVNKANLSKAVAGRLGNNLWFHIPEGISTTNNLVLVYDTELNSWWIFRGIEAFSMIDYNDGVNVKTYTGHATQGYVVQQDTGYNDLGVAISAYWMGKNFDGGDPVRIKKFKKAFAVDANGLVDSVFNYRLNYGSWQTPTVVTDLNDVRKYTIANGKCRYFQPKFTHVVLDQEFCLSGFEAFYKLKKAK